MSGYKLRQSIYHRRLEKASQGEKPAELLSGLKASLAKAKSQAELPDLAKEVGLIDAKNEHEEPIQRSWFANNDQGKKWDKVARAAYRELVQALIDDWRPVNVIWLQGGTEFAAVVDKGPHQLTYVVITPDGTTPLTSQHVEVESTKRHFYLENDEVCVSTPLAKLRES